MIVSKTHGVIFVKSMKTGGSSTEAYIRTHFLGHGKTPEEEYEPHISPTLIVGHGTRSTWPGFKTIPGHMRPSQIIMLLGEESFNSYHKIVNVRNPYEISVSLFWWWMWFSNDPKYAVLKKAGPSERRKSFLRFLLLKRGLLNAARLSNYICVVPGIPFPAFYIRYENLENDIKQLRQSLGILAETSFPEFKSDIRLVSTHYSEFYTPISRAIVWFVNRWEIRHLKYRFEEVK